MGKNVPDIPFVLVGNKSDIPEPIRVVKKSKGLLFAKEKGCRYFETSSKLRTQIDECVTDLCQQSLSRRKEIEAIRKNLKKTEKKEGSCAGSVVNNEDKANHLSRSRVMSQSCLARKNSLTALSGRSQSRGRRQRKKCVIL